MRAADGGWEQWWAHGRRWVYREREGRAGRPCVASSRAWDGRAGGLLGALESGQQAQGMALHRSQDHGCMAI